MIQISTADWRLALTLLRYFSSLSLVPQAVRLVWWRWILRCSSIRYSVFQFTVASQHDKKL